MALDVYLWNHDRGFLELKLGKELAEALEGRGYLEVPENIKESLRLLLAKHTLRGNHETPLLDNWSGLCSLFPSPLHSSLSLLRAVLISSENSSAPPQYHNSYYRTGLEVTEFLLDYLNLIGGFHAYSDKTRTDYPHVLVVLGNAARQSKCRKCWKGCARSALRAGWTSCV